MGQWQPWPMTFLLSDKQNTIIISQLTDPNLPILQERLDSVKDSTESLPLQTKSPQIWKTLLVFQTLAVTLYLTKIGERDQGNTRSQSLLETVRNLGLNVFNV